MFFNHFFDHQINRFNLSHSRAIRIISILIVSTIAISDSAFAEVLDRYCLSTVGQVEPKKPEKAFTQHPVPPYLSQKVNDLPELYQKSCNAFFRFFDACTRKTFFTYSPTLDRVFFQGYRPTTWGGGFVHLEISKEGTKSVPSELVNSGFEEDIPALNGVLFAGHANEALFYDGDKVTNLSQYFPNPGKRKSSRRGWSFQETFENRFFLVSAGYRSRGFPFVAEIKPGPSLSIISVPKELKNTWLKLLTLPDDYSRIWGIARNNIFLETKGRFESVVNVPQSLQIVGPSFIEQNADGSITFQVENKTDKSITNYFLKIASPTANCEIMLDEEQPVLLDPESNN